ncbi:MAG: hypothetical protein GY847_21845 [Proteobacteria bacterium]|nr:hypothetical protein [Pseudomonadota bacterium]
MMEYTSRWVVFVVGALILAACGASRPESSGSAHVGRESSSGKSGAKMIPQNPVHLEMVPQIGHTDTIVDVAVSPDVQFVITASLDHSVRLWDLASGSLIRVFRGIDAREIKSLRFINKQIVHVSMKEGAGRFISIDPNQKTNWSEKLLSSGDVVGMNTAKNHVYYYSNDKVKILDSRSGDLIRSADVSRSRCNNASRSISLSADEKQMIIACAKGPIELWDFQTDAKLGGFDVPGDLKHVYFAEFMEGSENFVTLSNTAPNTTQLAIWNRKTGRVLKSYEIVFRVTEMSLLPGGKRALLSVKRGRTRIDSIWILDIFNETVVTTFETNTKGTLGFALTPNQEKIVAANDEHGLDVWDVRSGNVEKSFGGTGGFINHMDISDDGALLATATSGGEIHLWDMQNASLLNSIGEVRSGENNLSLDISSNKKRMVTYSELISPSGDRYRKDEFIRIWDLRTQSIVFADGFAERTNEVFFHPDNNRFIRSMRTGGKSGTGLIVRGSGRRSRKSSTFDSPRVLESYLVSPLGYGLLEYSAPNEELRRLEFLNLESFERRQLPFTSKSFDLYSNVRLLDRDHFIVNKGTEISGYNLESTSPVFKYTIDGAEENSSNLNISKDGRLAVLSYQLRDTTEKTIVVFGAKTGKIVAEHVGVRSAVRNLMFVSKSRVAWTDTSGVVQLWNFETDHSIWLFSRESEWVVYTDDGYFDASRNGGDLVVAVNGLKSYKIDQLALRNNRPDILLERAGIGDTDLISHFYNLYVRRLKKFGISEKNLQNIFNAAPIARITDWKKDGKFLELSFSIQDRFSELNAYNIYVNDVPVFGAEGKRIEGKIQEIKKRIELNSGDNNIEVSAMNVLGVESLRPHIKTDYKKTDKSDLYYIGFGVSKYDQSGLELKYAAKDVLDLKDTIDNMRSSFNNVYAHTYTDGRVNAAAFSSAKDLLKRAGVDDTVIVFVAGHGLYDTEDELKYYFLMKDSNISDLSKTAITFETIEYLMQGIRPRKKLLLLDTCQSGELEEEQEVFYAKESVKAGLLSRGIKKKMLGSRHLDKRKMFKNRERYIYNDLFRRSGAIIFSSSRGDELSYESDRLENGVFTAQVIKALSTKNADTNGDNLVSTGELRTYVMEAVAEETFGLQNPVVDRDNLEMIISFPL